MSDSISRQAAIDVIDEWIKAFRENGHRESAADARFIQDGIIQLPSAQPFEDIHREKEQAYYCGYEDGAKAARSALRRKKMKGAEDECINRIADAVVQKLMEMGGAEDE